MHIIAPPSSAPFSIIIAEHQPRMSRRFVRPTKTVWFTVQPSDWIRLESSLGLKPSGPLTVPRRVPTAPPGPFKHRTSVARQQFAIAPVVTIHF